MNMKGKQTIEDKRDGKVWTKTKVKQWKSHVLQYLSETLSF